MLAQPPQHKQLIDKEWNKVLIKKKNSFYKSSARVDNQLLRYLALGSEVKNAKWQIPGDREREKRKSDSFINNFLICKGYWWLTFFCLKQKNY